MVLIGPADGGVAHVSRMLAQSWPTSDEVTTVLISDDARTVDTTCSCGGTASPAGWSVAARAARAAWSHRRCLRSAWSWHVELGRTSAGAFWLALAASLLLRRRIVLGAHDLPAVINHPAAALVRQAPGWWDRIAYRLVAPLLDATVVALMRRRTAATVVLSKAAASAADAAGWANVVIAAHGAARRTAEGEPSSGSYVLLAGFLGPGKGLDVLERAWQQVASPLPLVIAGGASATHSTWVEAVRARFDDGQNPPTWLGFVSDDEFDGLFRRAAVVVLPYEQSNPASGVLVRAMVEGRAIVATRVPAVTDEVEDEVDGLLVNPGDPGQLATALGRVTSCAELRDRLGAAAGSAAAARHSWPTHASTIARAHELVLTAGQSSGTDR